MNGFLSPTGEFYKCKYGEHSELAQKLTIDKGLYSDPFDPFWRDKEKLLKKNGYIYFGHTGDLGTNTDSYVFCDINDMDITDAQIQWVENNRDILSEKQYGWFKSITEHDLEKQRYYLFNK